MFPSEAALTEVALSSSYFQSLLATCGNSPFVCQEMPGLFGVPDVVVAAPRAGGGLLAWAFEMKLSHWRRALIQAFRYRAFADEAWVCMDAAYVHRALAHAADFQAAGIGLVSVATDGTTTVHVLPGRAEPYSPQLRSALVQAVDAYWSAEAARFAPVRSYLAPGWCSDDVYHPPALTGRSDLSISRAGPLHAG